MKKYLSLIVLFLLSIILIGCEEKKTEEYCTVIFDCNGGSLVSEQVIIKGDKVIKPTSPTKEGFVFKGWYIDDIEWDFENNCVTKDITLKAKWSLKLPEAIEIAGNNRLEVGTTIDLSVQVLPLDTKGEVRWSSSNEYIATVDENGVVTGISKGECTITVASKINPDLSSSMPIIVIEEEIIIEGPKTIYYGYSNKLTANVYTLKDNNDVVWSSLTSSKCKVNEDGVIEGIGLGKAKVKCSLASDPEIYDIFELEVIEEPGEATIVDMQGYEIVIMQASSAIQNLDPFDVNYKDADKLAKQKAWKTVEDKFNCDISVEAYPDTAQWGTPRQQYIIDCKANDNVQADLYVITSSWIPNLVKNDTAVDVSGYYEKYGRDQMEPGMLGAGSYNGGLYIANTGIDDITNYIDHGLFYNVNKIAEHGAEDPAKMFNEGRWTYSNFEKWANDLQSKLPEDTYAIGGHPYYYYLGMNAAANIKVIDYATLELNIDSLIIADALKLLNSLVAAKVMNPNGDWAEGTGYNGFHTQETLMISGRFWFIHEGSRWYKGMWEEGKYPNIGYVPYPYPDNMNKEDTRVSTTGGTVYMFSSGRKYGNGFGIEEVYRAITEMYLNTIVIQKTVPDYDSEVVLRESLSNKLFNEASIEAAMFYNAKRVLYDPTELISFSFPFYNIINDAVYDWWNCLLVGFNRCICLYTFIYF